MSASWDGLLDFLERAGRLKGLPRKGWVDRGVAEPESVADHSYRLALLTLLIGSLQSGLDVSRAVVLALVHDLPEALAGDWTPFDRELAAGTDPVQLFRRRPSYAPEFEGEKAARERAALHEMVSGLPDRLARLLCEAWEEYEAGVTVEARLVRQLDKLETALQAVEYRTGQPVLVIDSFLLGAEDACVESPIRELLHALLRRAGTVGGQPHTG
jgi:putative hydrolase of HD superfamily